MDDPYDGFLGNLWQKFPQLSQLHNPGNSELPQWGLDEFIESRFHNFSSDRRPLYHLSRLIEDYAKQNYAPLVTSFEKPSRFKFVETRYGKLVDQIPKISVIADFGKTQFFLSPKINVLNCMDTDLVNVWCVFTKAESGPFGVIAEEFQDGKFRGFFSFDSTVCNEAIKQMEDTLSCSLEL